MWVPEKLSDNLTLAGNHYLNTFILHSKGEYALIEPGIASTAPLLLEQLQHLGIRKADVRYLFLTHAHADHINGAGWLKANLPGLEVLASVQTEGLLQKEKVQEAFDRDERAITRNLQALSAEPTAENFSCQYVGLVDRTIEPGEFVSLGDLSLEVLETPGHCLGGIGYWEPETGILFCSDYLGFMLSDGEAVPNVYVDYRRYQETFDKLSDKNAEILCPGHTGSFAGGQIPEAIESYRRALDRFAEEVLRATNRDEDMELLQDILHERYYHQEAKMFSEANMHFCVGLMMRRIKEGLAVT
jgi:glyoxylase-like metal-dependent hydrolase (beta-lactamase superfamily II)